MVETGVVIPKVELDGSSPQRLYFKEIEFHSEFDAKFTAKMLKGYKVRRNFLSCDVITNAVSKGNVDPSPLNGAVLTSSIVNPVALYTLLYPTKVMTGPSVANGDATAVTLASTQTACLTPVGTLSNTQITLNGTPIYPNLPLIEPQDYWNLLKERLVGTQNDINGSPLTYHEFLNSNRIHYFDLSKVAELYKNQPVSLNMTSSRGKNIDGSADVSACDFVFLVEKLNTLELDCSNGVVTMLAGQGL
jgi:hypothetical protein